MKDIVIDCRTKEQKRAEAMEKIHSKIQNGREWVGQNMGLMIKFAPIVMVSAATITGVVGKQINLREKKLLKELYCYDRSLGHYWKLRRALTNSEWLTIDSRKNNGERLADILADLKVLR